MRITSANGTEVGPAMFKDRLRALVESDKLLEVGGLPGNDTKLKYKVILGVTP